MELDAFKNFFGPSVLRLHKQTNAHRGLRHLPFTGVVVQLLRCVQLFATPWIAACQASLSLTISWNLLKFMSIGLHAIQW